MRSGALLAIAAWITISGVSTEARSATPPAGSPSAPSGGIFLVVRSTSDVVTIQRVVTTRKPVAPAKPSLTVAGWEQNPLGTEELIVTVHDRKGKILGEYGFPTRRIAFADSLGVRGKSLTGGPKRLASVDLPVHVPTPDNAVLLYLWRGVIRAGGAAGAGAPTSLSWTVPGNGPYGPVALTVDPLGAYPLMNGPLPNFKKFELPRIPIPPRPQQEVPKFVTSIQDLLTLLKERPLFPVGSKPQAPSTPPCPSHAAQSELLGPAFAVVPGFNIVILGEGYLATQMDAFHADALNVRDALFRVSPFLEFKSKINVYRIDTPSAESGVDYCPKECPKQLCYRGTKNGHACSWDVECPGGTCDAGGKCFKGSNDGATCDWDASCPGGTCDPYALCSGGPKAGDVCGSDSDCNGRTCAPTRVCHLGPTPGALCATDMDCGSGTCPPRGGCPPTAPDSKMTALDVTGEASLVGVCTEFKADFAKLYDVTCSAIDPAEVNLTIVLVNCDAYGGMTYPTEKTIFVAARHAPEMIAHEAGHAIAPLGEEYVAGVIPCMAASCNPIVDCAPPMFFKNVALDYDVTHNQVSWFHLATAAERSGATFAKIEHLGSVCYEDVPADRPYGSGTAQTLGLYWGAQYLTDGTDPWSYGSTCQQSQTCRVKAQGQCVTLCYDPCDSRGAKFYRPMPRCMMRFLNEPFCRVCYCELHAVLTARTGLVIAAPACLPPP